MKKTLLILIVLSTLFLISCTERIVVKGIDNETCVDKENITIKCRDCNVGVFQYGTLGENLEGKMRVWC